MNAVVKTSGRQYRVEEGTILDLNRMTGAPGDTVTLADSVLMVSRDGDVTIGAPVVEGATVDLEILEHRRGTKITVFKMKRRKRYRRKMGHRQELTRVAVRAINVP